MFAIETHQLCKRYPGAPVTAVTQLDLSVPRGTVFGFLGPNGAGKTTTIGMLLGNIRPTSGSGLLLGKPLGDRETRRRVGYLPEKFQFHEFLTATEFLELHGRLYGLDRATLRQRIPSTLERVGLAERAHSKLRTFSKGMQQRIGFAQAVLHQPELVILDEPTSALDPLGRRAVRDLILELRANGTTVLLNSHLLSEVESTCDAVAIVRQGTVRKQGTRDALTAAAPSVVVELEAISPPLEQVARTFGETSSTGNQLTVTTPQTPELVAALVAAGGKIEAVRRPRLTLEEVFVRLMEDEQ